MGLKAENVVTSFIIFSLLVGLVFNIYHEGFVKEYGLTPNSVNDEGNDIIQSLKDINILSGLEDVKSSMLGIFGIGESGGSEFDILGSIKAGGLGILKIFTGLITAPIEILGIITGFYAIPSIVSLSLGLLVIIYIGMMVLKSYIGEA